MFAPCRELDADYLSPPPLYWRLSKQIVMIKIDLTSGAEPAHQGAAQTVSGKRRPHRAISRWRGHGERRSTIGRLPQPRMSSLTSMKQILLTTKEAQRSAVGNTFIQSTVQKAYNGSLEQTLAAASRFIPAQNPSLRARYSDGSAVELTPYLVVAIAEPNYG